ncbi:MAG: DUF1592 domain-containing protein [Verrucomicrobiaceae bacterium]
MLRALISLILCPLVAVAQKPTLEHHFETVPAEFENAPNASFSPNGLTLKESTLLRSKQPPRQLTATLKKSNALTLSAWITPANLGQAGPARIFTISKDSSNRNLTLGQDGNKISIRLRTTSNSTNGLPSLDSKPTLKAQRTHVAFTRGPDGKATLFLNGQLSATATIKGDLNNWDDSYLLAFGNEFTNDRPWLGTIHHFALYNRALSPPEIQTLFKGETKPEPILSKAEKTRLRSESLFVSHVEPIFSRHCLECHDAATAEGDFDLSQKLTAFADPDIIRPDHFEKSVLWKMIRKDEMPEDRDPLSDQEKAHLKEWITTGAAWPGSTIDPAAHTLHTKPLEYPRRLTVREYGNTVMATTGVSIRKEAKELLPPDLRADGFSNTAYNLGIDLKHIQAHARLADTIVSKINVAEFARVFSTNRSLTQKPLRTHIAAIGKHFFRGPLNDDEIDLFQGVATTVGSGGGDFDQAMAYIIRAMLQSPRFLYRVETEGAPDAYQIASRLSYLTLGSPPDKQLMDAASNGSLHNTAEVEKQTRRLLDDPRARAQMLHFISEWLHLDRLNHLNPGTEKFPDWDPALAQDMRHETLAFAQHILWEKKRPLADLLDAQVTFLTPRLAKHYGLTPNPVGKQSEFTQYDLSKNPERGGLLTQGSLLTIGGDEASMVTRGLFVLHSILRGTVNDPPPTVDTTPVPSKPGLSQRSIALERLADNSCAGCHSKFEPLSFALERYDGIARYSLKDHHKNDLRQDGEILIPGAPTLVKYQTAPELMTLLANSSRVSENIAWKLAQFALGRPLATTDRPHLQSLTKPNLTYQDLIISLASSPLISE